MNITCAPLRIKKRFDNVKVSIPATDPEVVFKYYTAFFHLSNDPCDIASTPFKTVDDFKTFLLYILRECKHIMFKDSSYCEFPNEPFGYPLLLTADCKLQSFRKVIKSAFTHLFPQSQEHFLHPELLKLNLKQSYFISKDEKNEHIVNDIIAKALPQALSDSRVQNASQIMKREFLVKIWSCLESDPVFTAQLINVLKNWALLLTTDNRLFSCPSKDCLLPVVEPDLGDDIHKPVCLALKCLKMPFLAPEIITIANQFCPILEDYQWILKNLCYLHKEVGISSSLPEETLKTLIGYLKNIDFRNSTCRDHLYALPLFEDIDDNMTTLVGKTVHVWPDNVCSAGRRKWLKEEKVVFLKQTGHWRKLGNNLGIQEISSESVYVRYIFPEFSNLSEEERFKHLEHIRDHMYNISQASILSRDHSSSDPARQFISALKTLPCIGVNDDELRCVSEFCDHRIDVFTTFPQNSYFLPEKFYKNVKEWEENKWMKLFCKLGLRQSLSKKEYLQFCRQTEGGMQHDTEKSSSVLLRYLLSSESSAKCPEEWYRDSHFLTQVSDIRFVCIAKLPELEWIVSSCSSSGSGTLALTTLRGATVAEHKTLLWTVRPIVQLPYMAAHNHSQVLQLLHVNLIPSVDDVIANVINITRSKFSKVSQLHNYPEECNKPKDCNSIIEVIVHNFVFLKNYHSTADQLKQLSDSHCIPVYADPRAETAFRNNFVALMKPHCVLTTRDADEYFPFLHKLPNDLNVVSDLLENIGVSSCLELRHFRILLETASQDSDGLKLEPNTTELMRRAIRGLYTMLKEKRRQTYPRSMSDAEISEELAPLHLPTAEGKLHLSTSLVYRDTSIYEHIKVDLSGTDLCVLSIQRADYDFSEEELCSQIPDNIRPKKMSQCFIQKVLLESTTDIEEESEVATALQRSFSLPTLKTTLLLLTGKITKDEKLREQFGPILSDILENFKVQCIKNLNASIELITVLPHRVIGTAKVDHHFQEESDEKTVTLSLDSHFNLPIMALQPVAEYLISRMKPLCSTTESESALSRLEKFFLMAMQGQSSSDHSKILKKAGTDLSLDHEDTDFKFEADITPRLGKDIPESWHHRLDQNINNIFHSEEWVGYEVADDHMIFAQVICPVLPEETAVLSAVLMKYKIFIKQEDEEEGIVVSSLKLFKFLKGRNPPSVKSEAEAKAIDVYKGPEMPELRKEKEQQDLKEVKKELCEELRIIWKLPKEERKQAIKRLYLKWHPDKNIDNPDFAEEIFKFLKHQIDRLELDLPLEDPDGDHSTTASGASYRTYNAYWDSFFREWDHTAYRHRQSSRSEQRYQQSYYGGGGGGGGGGGYGSGWWGAAGGGTANFFDFDGDFTRPSPNQQEGRRWVRQARGDYRAVCILHEQMASFPEVACHVCFMAHQVAEKALKGGKYAVCGLGEKGRKNHNLIDHARALQVARPDVLSGLSDLSAPLDRYYQDTRYPDQVPPPQIPLDTHTAAEADQAKCNAENILKMMENIV